MDTPLYLPGISSPIYKRIRPQLLGKESETNTTHFGRREDCIETIRQGNGVALFSFKAGTDPKLDGLKIIDITPEIRFEYGFGYRDSLNPGELAFLSYLRDVSPYY